MSETVTSTATVVDETPVKKPRFSKKTLITIGVSAATAAAATLAFVKANKENEDLDTEVDFDPTVVETLSELENLNQS